jgi:hypothetical protein
MFKKPVRGEEETTGCGVGRHEQSTALYQEISTDFKYKLSAVA